MKTLRTAIALLAAALAGQTASAADKAQADPMAAFYGNTLSISVPSGYYYASRFIDPDGTWIETRGGGVTARGFWRREGDQICHWQAEVVNPQRYCYPAAAPSREVGEEWVSRDPNTGNEVIQKIEPGRKPLP